MVLEGGIRYVLFYVRGHLLQQYLHIHDQAYQYKYDVCESTDIFLTEETTQASSTAARYPPAVWVSRRLHTG